MNRDDFFSAAAGTHGDKIVHELLPARSKRLLDEIREVSRSATPGFHSRRMTAESTFGRGVNAPGGTVKPRIGVA